MALKNIFVILMTVVIFEGCGFGSNDLDSPTTGEISISVDETFSLVMESQVNTFTGLYKYAKINVHYASENEAFQDLLNDSARLVISARKLSQEEENYFSQIKIFPKTIKVATDAIALIVHKENSDSLLTLQQLAGIMTGKLNKWKQINPNSSLSEIQIVFDNKNSSTARYVKENINGNLPLPPNCYAVEKNAEVVEYVSGNINSFGVIGVNWISDDDDPTTTGFLKKVKVVAIADSTNTGFYKPYQAYIAKKNYPLCRDVYIVSREARNGLGTGFASFVASDRGQRIILKSGLIPATMPVRIVEIKE